MRKQSFSQILALFITLPLVTGRPSIAQPAKSVSERSYLEARQWLDRAIQATGGLEALQGLKDVARRASGTAYNQGQSLKPDAPYTTRPVEITSVTDFAGKRNLSELVTASGGLSARNRQLLKGETGFTINLLTKMATPLSPAGVSAAKNGMRRDPAALLLTARSRAETLRSLGTSEIDQRRQNVFTFADTDGTQITLYCDSDTGLLSKYETLADNPVLGDTLTEFVFSDYRPVGRVKLPFRLVVRTGGEATQDLKYSEIRINSGQSDALFELPQGFQQGTLTPASPTSVVISKLAEDVYFAGGSSHNSLFVNFRDHILVVEAPQSDERSQAVLAKIRETVPGKPIKYLIPTHYHFDHVGGIRGFVAEGATIVTTSGNKGFVEKMAQTPHNLKPDTLSLKSRAPVTETFAGKRVFTDGKHTVELHDVGPNPHVEEAVVAYLPKERILFVSDLFSIPVEGPIPEAGEATREFAKRIEKLNLQVDQIVPGHGRVGTKEDLYKALAQQAPSP